MKRSGAVLLLGVAALLLCLPEAGPAADFDGSTALVCDLAEASQCDGVALCSDVTLAEIQLPTVIHVDFAARQLSSPEQERTSPIAAVEKLEGVLVIQGQQNGRGWTMVIDRSTGHLSAALADVEGGFVVAGACTTR